MNVKQLIALGLGYLVFLLVMQFEVFGSVYIGAISKTAIHQFIMAFSVSFPIFALITLILFQKRSFISYLIMPICLAVVVYIYAIYAYQFRIPQPTNILGYLQFLVLPYLFHGVFLITVTAFITDVAISYIQRRNATVKE